MAAELARKPRGCRSPPPQHQRRARETPMRDETVDRLKTLLGDGRYRESIAVVREELKADPDDWNAWYVMGFAHRALGEIPSAIGCYCRALELAPDEPQVLLALGIAYQLNGDLMQAVATLRRATEVDPGLVSAHNSLGYTLGLMDDWQAALDAYEVALERLFFGLCGGLENARTNRIYKHRNTRGEVWLRYALEMAIAMAAMDGSVQGVVWPTGAMAAREEETEEHEGLYFEDVLTEEGRRVRYYLPNYFNTVREMLRADMMYAILLNNIGKAHARLGNVEEARECFLEAIEFTPPGQSYETPWQNLASLDS